MKNIKLPQMVKVFWLDAASHASWKTQEEVESIRPEACVTIGFVIKKTEDYITVASTYSPDGTHRWNDISTIPTVFALKIIKMKNI